MPNLKIAEAPLNNLEIHKLALSTPSMTEEQFNALKIDIQENGQLEPIKIYRTKVIDGRHRTKAMRELGYASIKAIYLDPSTNIEEVRQIVNSYEIRRHQTPTQKAIYALREYNRLKAIGQKASQVDICEQFGTNRMMLSRAKKLDETVSSSVITHLFNGGKINIGGSTPLLTDSLLSIYNHFQTNESTILKASTNYIKKNISDDEREVLKTKVVELKAELGLMLLKELNILLYQTIKEMQ